MCERHRKIPIHLIGDLSCSRLTAVGSDKEHKNVARAYASPYLTDPFPDVATRVVGSYQCRYLEARRSQFVAYDEPTVPDTVFGIIPAPTGEPAAKPDRSY